MFPLVAVSNKLSFLSHTCVYGDLLLESFDSSFWIVIHHTCIIYGVEGILPCYFLPVKEIGDFPPISSHRTVTPKPEDYLPVSRFYIDSMLIELYQKIVKRDKWYWNNWTSFLQEERISMCQPMPCTTCKITQNRL